MRINCHPPVTNTYALCTVVCKQTLNLVVVGPIPGKEGPLGGGVGTQLEHRDTKVQVLTKDGWWSQKRDMGKEGKGGEGVGSLQHSPCIENHGRRRHGSQSHGSSRMGGMCPPA